MNEKELLRLIDKAGNTKIFKPEGTSEEDYAAYDRLVEQLIHLENNGLVNKVSFIKNHGGGKRKYLNVAVIGGLKHKGIQSSHSSSFSGLRSGIVLAAIILFGIGLYNGFLWLLDPSGDYEPWFAVGTLLGPLLFAGAQKIRA